MNLVNVLKDGREIPCSTCTCKECGNEWFIAAMSADWTPRFCPYCGVVFVTITEE